MACFFIEYVVEYFVKTVLVDQLSTSRDSDNLPSFVVGLSQTRSLGTGQFLFIGIDEELGTAERHRQFHLAQLYGIPLLYRNSKPIDSVR